MIITKVTINTTPDVRCRIAEEKDKFKNVLSKDDKKRTLWDDKAIFPFKTDNSVIVTVYFRDLEKFSFKIPEKYVWNGADIPKVFWRLIGSQSEPSFLVPSLVHDYLIEYRKKIQKDVLKERITMSEYRKMTSLVFRELLKQYGTGTIKANIMSFSVQLWQLTGAGKQWKNS